MGAWIETFAVQLYHFFDLVAPHVGAWIETDFLSELIVLTFVAPHLGAWIETVSVLCCFPSIVSRTPCGCVD